MKKILLASATAVLLSGVAGFSYAAGYTVQSINSPEPSVRMSENGAIAGYYQTKCGNIQPGVYACFNAPWYFDGKRVTKLSGLFPTNVTAQASAINDSFEVTGNGIGAWVYSGGVLSYTGSLPNSSGTALVAINNLGIAAGSSGYSSGVGRAVTYQNGLLAEVAFNDPTLSALTTLTSAVDINDSGMIAGWYKATDNTEHGFVVNSAGTVTFIPNLTGSPTCRPVRLSQVNATTGDVWVAGNCNGRPYIYNLASTSPTELTYPGGASVSVSSIDSQGVAVGAGIKQGNPTYDGSTALLWPAGSTFATVPTDLNANNAFAPSTGFYVRASDINESGTILTQYITANSVKSFLLHPAP
ncbi:MAG: hypothetical protein ACXV7J_15005 [Methylomonas sp.]